MSSDNGKSSEVKTAAGISPDFLQHEGFWYTPWFYERVRAVQKEFRAEPSDLMLCSFPKSGATWLKALIFAILTRSADQGAKNQISPLECFKFIEGKPNPKAQDLDLSPLMKHPRRLLATQIGYRSLPKSIAESGCKIIYVCRDPRDILVSGWNFRKEFTPGFEKQITFEEVFDKFCTGVRQYGPIWDHVLGYWKAAQEHPDEIFFLKYEDLKSQTSFHIKKLAAFLDEPFTQEEEDNGMIENITKVCLEHLSNMESNKSGSLTSFERPINNKLLFRKGEVGDWKNYLTPEMKDRLDVLFRSKFDGTGLNVMAE